MSETKRLSPEAIAGILADNHGRLEKVDLRRNIRRLVDHIEAITGTDPNDPIARQHDGEPRFALMARDPIAPGLTRLWAALRARKTWAVSSIVKNLVVEAGKLPWRPDADPQHAISAQAIANEMDIWQHKNTPHGPKSPRGVDLDVEAPAT